MWIWGDSKAFKNSHKYTGFKKPPRCWLRNELNCPKLSCWADTRTKCMPSKLVKASQDKESNLPRVNICPLFQVPNYEHTHTHIQEHTHRDTHTGTHTQRNTHIGTRTYMDGQGSHHRRAWGARSGALMVCQGFTTCTAAWTRGCSSTPSSSSATLWGKGASAGSGGGAGCTLTRGGTKLRPTVRASVLPPWDPPSPVGWGQPQSIGETSAHTGLWP